MSLIILMMLGISLFPVSATPSYNGVSAISHSPVVAEQGKNITISISFVDTANVSSVGMFYCRIEPDYLCHIPPYKLVLSDSTYSITFNVVENSTQVIGYHLYVDYTDDTRINFPDERQLDYGLTISEPIEGSFYYRVEIGQDISTAPSNTNGSETSITPVYFGMGILGLLLISYKKRN